MRHHRRTAVRTGGKGGKLADPGPGRRSHGIPALRAQPIAGENRGLPFRSASFAFQASTRLRASASVTRVDALDLGPPIAMGLVRGALGDIRAELNIEPAIMWLRVAKPAELN